MILTPMDIMQQEEIVRRKDMGRIIVQSETTECPLQLMGKEAGICWGADTTDKNRNYARGKECMLSGHGRVLEYPQVYLIIEGYSARVIRELYTHIGGAPTRLQASTRYIDYSKQGFEYIVPPAIEQNEAARVKYTALMSHINREIDSMIRDYNIPKEDAANCLPLGMSTKVVIRTNARQLIEMSRIRKCNRAYWEFRQLMKDLETALSEYSEEWKEIIQLEFKPKCQVLGYCNEKNSCRKKS